MQDWGKQDWSESVTVRAFAVLVVVLAIALPTRAGPPLLSLPAVIDRALANNPGLMVERLEVDRADAEQRMCGHLGQRP